MVNGKCVFKPDGERRIFDYSSEEDSKEKHDFQEVLGKMRLGEAEIEWTF